MGPERLECWTAHHNRRVMVVEVTDDPEVPVRISDRHGEIALTEQLLEQLLVAQGPAALAVLRRHAIAEDLRGAAA